MADFKAALKKVLRWEGCVFADLPFDKGGPTSHGITLKTYQMYFPGRTVEDLKHITMAEVETIYRRLFWNKIKGDSITSQSVAELLFDFSVNSGVKTAVKKIQLIVGTYADGIIGPISIGKINGYITQKDLFELLKGIRRKFYNDIVARDATQRKWLKGWMNRLNSYTFGN